MTATTTTVRVLVINPGEDIATVKYVPRELTSFNELVGGYIEGLTLNEGLSAYINEEGKMLGLPVNVQGDLFVRAMLQVSGRRLGPGDVIVGPLVVLGPPDRTGEDTDVPQAAVDLVHDRLGLDIVEVDQ